jgi:GT2 family glycosyltransferase
VDLSIVIVSYNTRALLEACLASLPAGCEPDTRAPDAASPRPLRYEVIVVDNASSDGSAAAVRERFPEARLIQNDTNRGFAAANNLAFPLCRGRCLVLLNADTEVTPGALSVLVAFLDAHPRVGAAGPRLLNPDGSGQPSGFPFPRLSEAVLGLLLHRQRAAKRRFEDGAATAGGAESVEAHDWLTGACLVIRREVLEEVGPLDEGFFFEAEDVDWCRRIRAAGWEICLVPAARVMHVRSASGIGFSPDALRSHAGHCYYFRKHQGRAAGAALGAAFWLYHLLGWVKYTGRVLLHGDPGDRRKQHVHQLGVRRFAWLGNMERTGERVKG